MSQVSVVKCNKYDKIMLKSSITKALDMIGGISSFMNKGNNVLLKVNLLSPKPPEAAVTTHPKFVEAVVELFKEAGAAKVMVGDSSGGAIAGKAVTAKAFKVSGIQDAAERAGAEVVNFDKTGVVGIKVTNDEIIYLAKPVVEADVVVSLPKLKTHSATLFTGAVKNMFGCIPGLKKAEYHRKYPNPNKFAHILTQIYSISRVRLSIMDGITAMEGNGPASGTPKDLGIILASRDGVALDSVASKIIGYDPIKIPYLTECDRRGLGIARLDKIQIKGLALEAVKAKDFRLPSNAFLTRVPDFIGTGLLSILKAVPATNPEKCNGCQVCVENCPPQVIKMKGKIPDINYDECIECLCCHELCPQNAMELKFRNPFIRLIAGLLSGAGRTIRH